MAADRIPIQVTVVIPTYQRGKSVVATLGCLFAQSLPSAQFEVVVVVDGSTDTTLDMLGRLNPPFRLEVVWQENARRAAACNAGIERARGQYLVILDDDMRPVPEFLAAHLRAHASLSRAGVLGPVPIPPHAARSPAGRYVMRKFARHLEALSAPGYELDLRDFYSGNFSIRTDVMREVGGFDPEFRLYGNEDLELSVRLRQAGVEIVYSPAAIAYQTYDKEFADVARETIEKGRTAVLLASKQPSALPRLKLATIHKGPRVLRSVRNAMLDLSRKYPRMPERVVALTTRLERLRLPLPDRYYLLILGYYYWVGVQTELEANRVAGSGLQDLTAVQRLGHG